MNENPSRPIDPPTPLAGNHPYPMPVQGQISDVHAGTAAGGGGGDGHMIAGEHGIQRYGDLEGSGVEGMDADRDHEQNHDVGDPHTAIAPQIGSNQLTLSFQGEVYVFDSVSPDKVVFLFFLKKSFPTHFT